MIEDIIKTHLQAAAISAYPDAETDEIHVDIQKVEMDYTKSKGRAVLGTEILTALVAVDSYKPIDRREFLRQIPRKEIDFGEGYRSFQTYKSADIYDYEERTGLKRTVFEVEYKHDILDN